MSPACTAGSTTHSARQQSVTAATDAVIAGPSLVKRSRKGPQVWRMCALRWRCQAEAASWGCHLLAVPLACTRQVCDALSQAQGQEHLGATSGDMATISAKS